MGDPSATTTSDLEELRSQVEALRAQVAQHTLSSPDVDASDAFFRLAFQDAPIGMALVRADERIVQANGALCEMLGYSADELLALTVPDITHPDDRTTEDRHKVDIYSGRKGAFRLEKRYLRKDGSLMVGQLSVSAIFDADGSPLYFIGQLEDVTEQRRVERQLAQSQRLDSIARLAGGVAHDFNNLLGVILGYTDLLREGFGAGTADPDDLEQIRRASLRAKEITRQLLAVGGRAEGLHDGASDVNGAMRAASDLVERVLGAAVDVVWDLGTDVGGVALPAAQVEQILLNLATNARDAMPSGGRFEVVSRSVHVGAGEQSQLAPGRYALIRVADTGQGMDAETAAGVFEPFFTTKAAGVGTGLGMATVYGMVRQAGGSIDVESEPGVGTRFRVFLPAAEPVSIAPEQESTPTSSRAATVLVVEDEPALRELCCRVLTEVGYSVAGAADAREAIAWLSRATRLDLLVSDIVMPGLSGVELAERVRLAFPAVQVLFMSGYSPDQTRIAAIEGATLLQKPFGPANLRQAAESQLAAVSD